MKKHKRLGKAKASARKHYVRKAAFEALEKEVRLLRKQLARHEKSVHDISRNDNLTNSASTAMTADDKPSPATPTALSQRDDLTLIKGIGQVLEKKLRDIGVERFEQIANWTAPDIDRFSAQLSFKGRIQREEWVRQARQLVAAESNEPG